MYKEKRHDIRIPLLNERFSIKTISLFNNQDIEPHYYQIADISENGIFVKIQKNEKNFKPHQLVNVYITLPGDLDQLILMGRVCRVNWAIRPKVKNYQLGFAVKFEPMSSGYKKIWDAYRIYLRNKQIINVSKRIISEFLGNKTPETIK